MEVLTRRELQQEQPFFGNPVVDFQNGVCMTHVEHVGAFDLDALTTDRISP
jgi:hypothetical protein